MRDRDLLSGQWSRNLRALSAIALIASFVTGCAGSTVETTPAHTAPPATSQPTSQPTEEATEEPTPNQTATEPAVGVANPASVYCEEQGGQLEIRTDEDGNEVGYCIFPDGSECEEWAFYRGECSPANPPDSTSDEDLIDTSELTPTVASDLPEEAFDNIEALHLRAPSVDQPLWAAFSQGMRNYDLDPTPNHFVAIYTREAERWRELTHHELASDDTEQVGPDYVMEVKQAKVEPNHIWLELHGGVGAHSGTYHLLRFNPENQSLTVAVSNFSASPGSGNTTDLNGDGFDEVVLNATDPYVFCYACGVYLIQHNVWRWDGSDMVQVSLETLPDSAPSELRRLNNRAVELAQAGLWKDALAAIDEAETLEVENATFTWNATLIRLTGEARRDVESAYPILTHIFYGDYDAALDEMRSYNPEQIFSANSPLIVDTAAEGWEKALSEHIIKSTNQALSAKPDLAAAYFLRGWATYLRDPTDPQVREDVEQAAEIAPAEPLFELPAGGS